MKRLWIAAGLLVAVFAATLVNAHYLNGFTGALTGQLTQAEAAAESGDWAGAQSMTRQAYDAWEGNSAYLHIMLRHADTDQIQTGFQEVLEFLQCREGGEYSAANARLIAQIGLLYEAEQLTLKNVL